MTLNDDSGLTTAPAAMIAEGYWSERFGRSDTVLGKIISLNGTPVSVVGVTPARYTGLTTGGSARVFVPLTLQPLLLPRAQIIGSRNHQLLTESLLLSSMGGAADSRLRT